MATRRKAGPKPSQTQPAVAQVRWWAPRQGKAQGCPASPLYSGLHPLRPCPPPLQATAAAPTSKGALYYAHQYGGVVLGTVACVGSIVGYDQEDPFMPYRLLAWMFVVLLALAIHETRPFRRMNYGDTPIPQGGAAEKTD